MCKCMLMCFNMNPKFFLKDQAVSDPNRNFKVL